MPDHDARFSAEVKGFEALAGFFRVPSLRKVTETASAGPFRGRPLPGPE
jgi:cytochrome c peroxidase